MSPSLMRLLSHVLSQSQLPTRFTPSKRSLRPLTSTTPQSRLTLPRCCDRSCHPRPCCFSRSRRYCPCCSSCRLCRTCCCRTCFCWTRCCCRTCWSGICCCSPRSCLCYPVVIEDPPQFQNQPNTCSLLNLFLFRRLIFIEFL